MEGPFELGKLCTTDPIHSDFRLEPMLLDRGYVEVKNLVIKAERRILNVLGFVVHVQHPHKLIHVYLHTLNLLESEELLQKAW